MAPGSQRVLGRVLQPLAVGLLDELVGLTLICPSEAELGKIPCPPAEAVFYPPVRWWQRRRKACDAIVECLGQMRLDLLHAIEAPVLPMARMLADELDLTYCVTSYAAGDARILQKLDHRAAYVLAVSRKIQAGLIEEQVAPAEQIRVVPPGVYPARHATCFEQLGNRASILAGGPLDDVDAYEPVLQAMALLMREQRECVFFIMGAGRAEHALRKRAEALELTDVLTFVSGQADQQFAGVCKAADLYLSPLDLPWLDLPCLQAMASGIPVIAPEEAGEDFLVDSGAVARFPGGDAEAMAETIAGLLDDRARARSLAEKALEYLRENHSASAMVQRLSDLYRQAVDGEAG
jgi:glycosyltransferase involved in cell wall biosynthesis